MMSAPSETLAALIKARDFCFSCLLLSSGLVALGVVLEGPEVIHEARKILRRVRTEAPSWITLVALIGWVLVVVGVAGEGISEALIFRADGNIQTFNDQRLADTQRDAEDAIAQVLEQGPRDVMLSGFRADMLVNYLRQYEGQKIQIRRCVFANDEVLETAKRLVALFQRAKWTVSSNSPDWGESNCLQPPNSPTESGIWVGTPSATPTDVARARATKLVQSLKKVPLVAALHSVRPDTVRAESGKNIQGRYDDPDSLVLVVLYHTFDRNTPASQGAGGFVIQP